MRASTRQQTLYVLLTVLLLGGAATAQVDPRWATLEQQLDRIFNSTEYQLPRFGPARWLADGTAYLCYCTPDELEAMREAQRARGEKPRYDGRWRPEPGKHLPAARIDELIALIWRTEELPDAAALARAAAL